jgi:hypothetical protein
MKKCITVSLFLICTIVNAQKIEINDTVFHSVNLRLLAEKGYYSDTTESNRVNIIYNKSKKKINFIKSFKSGKPQIVGEYFMGKTYLRKISVLKEDGSCVTKYLLFNRFSRNGYWFFFGENSILLRIEYWVKGKLIETKTY